MNEKLALFILILFSLLFQNGYAGFEYAATQEEIVYLYVPSDGYVNVYPVDDSYTDSYYSLHNYGDSAAFFVGKMAYDWWQLGWLKFDISDVPDNAYDLSATLRLSCVGPPHIEPEFIENAPRVAAHYSSFNDWVEEAITYSNQPSFESTALDSQPIYDKDDIVDWFTWDVTEAVMRSLGKDHLVSIVMKTSYYPPLQFNSKEGFGRPELIVEWNQLRYEFPTLISVVSQKDEEGKWRYDVNTTIMNNNQENIAVSWVYLNALNVTYVDETSEDLGISANHTVNEMLQPEETLTENWDILKVGFDKEPKFFWIAFKAFFMELKDSVTLYTVIPPDTTPPQIRLLSPENKTHPSDDISLTFAVSEPTSWIGYSLDGRINETINGNTTLVGLSDGMHIISVFANDTFGNMGNSDPVYFTVDTVFPTIEILSPKNKTYTNGSVSLSFAIDEAVSWIGYSLNGQSNVTISGNTTLSELSDGSHNLRVYAEDFAGNIGASDTVYFSVETAESWQLPLEWLITIIIIVAFIAGTTWFILYKRRRHLQVK